MEKRFIGINLIADQSAYTWGLIHQGQMLITFINIDRGHRMQQQNTYSIEIQIWVDAMKNRDKEIVNLFVIQIYKQPNLHS